MSELTLKPAVELLALLRAGEVSIEELAEAHIAAIERLEPDLNAFADFDADRVRAEAERLAAEPIVGPLHGLPVTVKSSIAVKGMKCEIGSLIHEGERPRHDAIAVERLRAAGALVLGTTNCPEFLMAWESRNRLHGRVNNPWNLARTAGGSSGGEAAAIAAGMSAAGLGSDSGGSVRVPAHFTGICSLKPTPGRVPGRGHLPPCVGPFQILGAIGPMARTMDDVSLMFRALAGQDVADPASPPVPTRSITLDEARTQTIGVFDDDGLMPVTGETRAAVELAAEALRAAGFKVEPWRPSTLELLRQLWWKFFVQTGAMFYEPEIRGREHQLSPVFEEFLSIADSVPKLTAAELLNAWAELDVVRSATLDQMRSHPLLLCPAAAVPAFQHGERMWMIDGRVVEWLDAWRPTEWFNALAAPAAVLPVSRSAEGLPIGVQLAGRPFEDELVLTVATALDRVFGYQPPPIAG